MRVLTFGIGLALALTLTSCGGGGPPRTTKKKTEPTASSTPALPTPPAPVKKPAPAKTTAAAKTEGSAPAGDAPAEAVDAGPKEALSSDVQMPGGRTIDAWTRMLDSKTKGDVLEALETIRLQGHAFTGIKAKVEALTKNADAEIAKAAQEAVAAIK
ncbi:MAG: hypothetical protein L6R28_21790 [Planctomycetes bacterium]|nr:hypothetical protein [Planctomycetota bacterium]